jgi:hypothetical protein
MKNLLVLLLLGAAAGTLCLTSCSKSRKAETQSGSGADAAVSAVASDSPVDMKIKWTVGRKYPLRIELNQSTSTDVPNQSRPVVQEMKLTQGIEFTVIRALDNGGDQLELKFESETMNVSQGTNTVVSFDSRQSSAPDANNEVALVLRAMIGARLQYFTDANGKVQRVEGVDQLAQRVAATGKPQAQALFQQMFSADTLKRYGSFADALPGHPVKIGDSWPYREDISTSIGIVTVDMKYTFKNWERHRGHNCAHILAQGDISTKTISTATGMAVEIQKGKITGEIWYDPALGMLAEVTNDQNMKLKITTRAQTMTSQFNQQVRVALVDVP